MGIVTRSPPNPCPRRSHAIAAYRKRVNSLNRLPESEPGGTLALLPGLVPAASETVLSLLVGGPLGSHTPACPVAAVAAAGDVTAVFAIVVVVRGLLRNGAMCFSSAGMESTMSAWLAPTTQCPSPLLRSANMTSEETGAVNAAVGTDAGAG